MEILAASINPCHQCVWRAPFIQCSGIEEPQEKMTLARYDKNLSRRAQWIIQAQSAGQPISIVSSLAGGIDGASDFPWFFVNVPALLTIAEILRHSPCREIRVAVVDPLPISRFLVEMFFARGRSGR